MGLFGILLSIVVLFFGLKLVGKILHGSSGWRSAPVTAIGVISIIAGLMFFGRQHASFTIVNDGDSESTTSEWLGDSGDAAVDGAAHAVPQGRHRPHIIYQASRTLPSWWMLVALGSILVICGALLTGRDRTRPAALKAVTVLGIAALVFILASFFSSPPGHSFSRDRIIKVAAAERAAEVAAEPSGAISQTPSDRPRKAKRPIRAKRPAAANRNDGPASDELPPRAGEIPVSAELAAQAKTTVPPSAPAPPAVAPPSTVPAPASATETAPVVDPPTVSVDPKPVDPAPQVEVPPAAIVPPTVAEPTVQSPQVKFTSAPTVNEKPTARPTWVDTTPKPANSVYSVSVKSGLFESVPECQRELDLKIKLAADEYIDEYLRDRAEHAANLINVPLDYLKEHIQRAEYSEVVTSETVGPMNQIHALLQFDDSARSDFQHRWHEAMVTNRLWYAGSGAALVLGLLVTLYGYLRLDVKTAGTHKGALQLAATLVALIVAAGALLLRSAVQF